MPIYEYQASGDRACDYCVERFEELQNMSEAPITVCPQCAAPVERVLSATHTPQKNIDISNKRIADAGFTRYEKRGDGYYEKTAGKGPQTLHRPPE